jgi:hypothetical protein
MISAFSWDIFRGTILDLLKLILSLVDWAKVSKMALRQSSYL